MGRMTTIVAVLAPFLAAANVQAQAFVPDLPPGSIYHLAFVTDGVRDATSDQISEYDAFVNADAATNPNLAAITWLALGSTPTVNAIDHVPISGPIFRLDGVKIEHVPAVDILVVNQRAHLTRGFVHVSQYSLD